MRRGVEVVAISRSGGPVAGATAVAAQADDPGALGAAFAGADVVYHLVHSLGDDDFAARDRAAAAGVARAAEAAGVAQIVFLGGLGEPGETTSASTWRAAPRPRGCSPRAPSP